MRVKKEYRTVSCENYQRFCQRYPDFQIPFAKWKQIITTCNELFILHALETGQPVKLPYGFGILAVHKWKVRSHITHKQTGEKIICLPVDWQATRKEGKKIYNFNFHTTGYGYKWKWFARSIRLTEADIWVFKPCRIASRLITRYVTRSHYAQLYKEWSDKHISLLPVS